MIYGPRIIFYYAILYTACRRICVRAVGTDGTCSPAAGFRTGRARARARAVCALTRCACARGVPAVYTTAFRSIAVSRCTQRDRRDETIIIIVVLPPPYNPSPPVQCKTTLLPGDHLPSSGYYSAAAAGIR